jgi:hypothetical protein
VRRVSIHTGIELLHAVFWPRFTELDRCVFLAGPDPDKLSSIARGYDRTGREATWNHTHIEDLFSHRAHRQPVDEDDDHFLDYGHPDSPLLCQMGKALAEIWLRKLRNDFPSYDFRVYYIQYDSPIVRFHRVRPDEPNWIDESAFPEAIARGEIILYDTRTYRDELGGS